MLDRMVEFKSAYWERALREIGDSVDIVVEADDLGSQQAPLMSPRTYRPDLIDAGIDILNPVQISAADMNLRELKQEFGRDLVFWGGGVDTQWVLGTSTSEEIRAHVKQNIEALAPGVGFIFSAVHDIQANVPPENILVMCETWREIGSY